MESILTGSIFFWGAFCFGEHFLESILRGAFGGKHLFGEHLTPNRTKNSNVYIRINEYS